MGWFVSWFVSWTVRSPHRWRTGTGWIGGGRSIRESGRCSEYCVTSHCSKTKDENIWSIGTSTINHIRGFTKRVHLGTHCPKRSFRLRLIRSRTIVDLKLKRFSRFKRFKLKLERGAMIFGSKIRKGCRSCQLEVSANYRTETTVRIRAHETIVCGIDQEIYCVRIRLHGHTLTKRGGEDVPIKHATVAQVIDSVSTRVLNAHGNFVEIIGVGGMKIVRDRKLPRLVN
mmetsp:Transcript_29132/g.61502  ORF Transcript_29132/g.61502 Transcript_29132/m.61502 type:complete len:228 (-) Transcript_29132:121-804(-)